MSRPIKFRVWDKDYKEMHVCGKNVHDSMSFNEDGTAYYYNLQNGEGSGEHGAYILMRYTGLNDRNGTEIYEGDIIQFEDMGEEGYEYKEGYDFTNRAVVVFKNGRYTLDKFMYTNSGVLEELDDHEETWLVIQTSEIVGNIHDHPHLLGDDKDGA